jgi:ankyrin repeat protein
MTPLMYAARQGALESARALMDGGANLNVQDPDGMTATILAIINGHYDVAAALVEKGADPNVADSSGMAALYAAVDMNTLPFMHGRPYPKPSGRLGVTDMVNVLLAHGADVNQRLKTPLLRRHNSTSTQSLGEGTTPLIRAAASGDVPLMRVLVDHGADTTLKQKNGNTMTMLAAGFGRRGDHNADALEYERGTPEELLRAVKMCVEQLHLDLHVANDQGDTALHVAHSGEIVRFLAAHGASLDAKNKRGQTALDAALARIDRSSRQLRPDAVAALKELSGASPAAPKGESISTAVGASPASRTP